jgi:hypothetical protein
MQRRTSSGRSARLDRCYARPIYGQLRKALTPLAAHPPCLHRPTTQCPDETAAMLVLTQKRDATIARSQPPISRISRVAALSTSRPTGPSAGKTRFLSAARTSSGLRRDGSTAPLSCGETSLGSDRTGPACRQTPDVLDATRERYEIHQPAPLWSSGRSGEKGRPTRSSAPGRTIGSDDRVVRPGARVSRRIVLLPARTGA